MKHRHITGPWELHYNTINKHGRYLIVESGPGQDIITFVKSPRVSGLYNEEKLARLIAAAPEMLEALEELITKLKKYDELATTPETKMNWDTMSTIKFCENVLKKARGES